MSSTTHYAIKLIFFYQTKVIQYIYTEAHGITRHSQKTPKKLNNWIKFSFTKIERAFASLPGEASVHANLAAQGGTKAGDANLLVYTCL
jgi:hypothetical protein